MSDLDGALLEAVRARDLAAVKNALDKGANVDAREAGGRTALMTASMPSEIPIMEALLQAGAQVNLQATLGETALIMAASGSFGGEAIKLLLANGADPNIADRDKKTPLMWLVDPQFHRGPDTSGSIEPLVAAGARINDRDTQSRTVLMWAVSGLGSQFDVRTTVLTKLVENGVDVHATDTNGETAMFRLVRFIDNDLALDNGPPCIQILVDAGADRNAVNNEGKTPLSVVHPNNSLVRELLQNLGFTE